MFAVEMLPANEGDALCVEYGDPERPDRILIDCGYEETVPHIVEKLGDGPARAGLELITITHIDNDHIMGALPLFSDPAVDADSVGEVWFNDRSQLLGILGPKEGTLLAKTIADKRLPWNTSFGGAEEPVVVSAEGQPLPVKVLPGGMRLTLLSPGPAQLKKLREKWPAEANKLLNGESAKEQAESEDEGRGILGTESVEDLAKRTFKKAVTPANGSSIAFLAEYADRFDGGRVKSVLFAGDAIEPVLVSSVERLLSERGVPKLKLDALKVSHHGSRGNTSPDLLALLDCPKYLLSSNGSGTEHPNEETIAWILRAPRTTGGGIDLYFNYLTEHNDRWQGDPGEDDYAGHFGQGEFRVEL
ncbi:MAG: hypothetical protein C0418_03765 [Coriobacteriaceae bacterium]|nr:hypothetical protein [Coriobacteriaceae bacterium]